MHALWHGYSYIAIVWYTVYPKKFAHGFVVLCFVVVMQSFIMNSHEVFIHIHQGCFAGTGAIVRLPQCQWSKPDGYRKISQCITTTKHSKAKTVCIFLGIYCTVGHPHRASVWVSQSICGCPSLFQTMASEIWRDLTSQMKTTDNWLNILWSCVWSEAGYGSKKTIRYIIFFDWNYILKLYYCFPCLTWQRMRLRVRVKVLDIAFSLTGITF